MKLANDLFRRNGNGRVEIDAMNGEMLSNRADGRLKIAAQGCFQRRKRQRIRIGVSRVASPFQTVGNRLFSRDGAMNRAFNVQIMTQHIGWEDRFDQLKCRCFHHRSAANRL